MSSLLNIGLTGLNASQAYLNTTSHNIANAATPGFHRQGLTQEARTPTLSAGLLFGQGTSITSVTRSYSQLLENQVMSADNRRAEFAVYNQFISQVDNLLADPDVGLTPGMNNFFAAMQSVSANPTNIAARQALISSAESLVARFQSIDARITEVGQGVEDEITANLGTINSYAAAIAELNQRIIVSQAAGGGAAANDLLDQRQQAIFELNTLVKVTALPQRDGSMSVFIGSGQALVMGNRAKEMVKTQQVDEDGRQMIGMRGAGGVVTPLAEQLITGGSLGGLLAFRRDGLEAVQGSLGLIATTLATAFNSQHKLGMDLNGMLGKDFFSLAPVVVQPPTAASVSIDAERLGELTGASYSLQYDAVTNEYILTDLATGNSTRPALETLPDGSQGLRQDGLIISGLSLAAGERAFLYPTRFAAGSIGVSADIDPRRVAAANPVAASIVSPTGSSFAITLNPLGSSTGMSLAVPPAITPTGEVNFGAAAITLTENAGVFTLNTASSGYSLAPATYTPSTDSGRTEFTLTGPNGLSVTFKLSGVPAVDPVAGSDSIQLSPNAGGVADNRNAVLLGALQTEKLLYAAGPTGGSTQPTATLNNAYAQLVSKVGNKTREAQSGERTQNSLFEQARAARDSVSGVNLDEEAANLVRYQQTYQAAGRVMSVAQRLFDELLSIAR